ncbi:MAG: hypothetical protein ACXW4B_11425 [Micavibrio sp.]
MGKGFLSKLMDRLTKPAPLPGLRDSDLKALETDLGDGVMRIADFLESYRELASANGREFSVHSPLYFVAVSSLHRQMTEGKTTFHYPKPETIEYREKNMFMVEDCYLPASTIVQVVRDLRDAGLHRNATLFAATLKAVKDGGKIQPPGYPCNNGYALESGVHAKDKYQLGLYEHNDTLVPVLNIRSEPKNAVPKFRP